MVYLMSTPIEELPIPIRPYAALRKAGVKTLADIENLTDAEMLQISQIGEHALEQVRFWCDEFRLNYQKRGN